MSNRSKYNRQVIGLDGVVTTVDIYRILHAFNVQNPMAQHAIKKLLCAGLRGHKNLNEDVDDIIDSLQKMKTFLGQQKIAQIDKDNNQK